MTLSSNWGFAIAELLNRGGLENNNGGIFASEDYCYRKACNSAETFANVM